MLDRRPNFQVVAEAGTVAEAIEAARRFQPDLVIMDVRLPDGSGIEACREIRAELPQTRVVMLTSYPDEEAVFSAIVAGASGYLLKQVRARDLVAALEAVGRGESLLDPAVTEKVLERVRRIATGGATRRARPADVAGAEDPAAGRRGQDQQGDRGRGVPVRQDGQELRQLDPLEAQPPAPRAGGGVHGEAPRGLRLAGARAARDATPASSGASSAMNASCAPREDVMDLARRRAPARAAAQRAVLASRVPSTASTIASTLTVVRRARRAGSRRTGR